MHSSKVSVHNYGLLNRLAGRHIPMHPILSYFSCNSAIQRYANALPYFANALFTQVRTDIMVSLKISPSRKHIMQNAIFQIFRVTLGQARPDQSLNRLNLCVPSEFAEYAALPFHAGLNGVSGVCKCVSMYGCACGC